MARENYPGAPIKEICRCHAWAKDIKNALVGLLEPGPLGTPIPKYNHVEILDRAKETTAQMNNPQRNIRRCIGADITPTLVLVLEQIGAYKRSQAAIGRADTDGEQAAQGQAEETRSPVSQRQPAAEE